MNSLLLPLVLNPLLEVLVVVVMEEVVILEKEVNQLVEAKAQPLGIMTSMANMVTLRNIIFERRRSINPTTLKRMMVIISSSPIITLKLHMIIFGI